jgi:hypothetical protein
MESLDNVIESFIKEKNCYQNIKSIKKYKENDYIDFFNCIVL